MALGRIWVNQIILDCSQGSEHIGPIMRDVFDDDRMDKEFGNYLNRTAWTADISLLTL